MRIVLRMKLLLTILKNGLNRNAIQTLQNCYSLVIDLAININFCIVVYDDILSDAVNTIYCRLKHIF